MFHFVVMLLLVAAAIAVGLYVYISNKKGAAAASAAAAPIVTDIDAAVQGGEALGGQVAAEVAALEAKAKIKP